MTGWRCPGCGRCYSPSIVVCPYCVATPAPPWPYQPPIVYHYGHTTVTTTFDG